MTELAALKTESRKFGDEYRGANSRKAIAQQELIDLQRSRADASQANEDELEARANALAEQDDRADVALINIVELDTEIDVKQRLVDKLAEVAQNKRRNQSRLADQFWLAKASTVKAKFDETGFGISNINGNAITTKSFERIGDMTMNELLEVCQLRNVSKCERGGADRMSVWSFLAKHVKEPSDDTISTVNAGIDTELGL